MEAHYMILCAHLAINHTHDEKSGSAKPKANPKPKSKIKVKSKIMIQKPILTEESYEQERIEKLKDFKYGYQFQTTITISKYIEMYNLSLEKGSRHRDTKHSIYCRVLEHRRSGKKLHFYTVRQGDAELQLLADKNEYYDQTKFNSDNIKIHRGDIVGVHGFIGKSNPGELSLYVTEIVLLAPCYKLLPKHDGLKNPEVRARKRHLDLIANPQNKNPFIVRAKICKMIRQYLDNRDFIEVNTPILSTNAGGATAKPFVTYHNDRKQEMFMRIAPELYLKKLITGDMERVYELGPVFRNEDCDKTHNSEFYTLEYYMANADYYTLMTMCEEMLTEIVSMLYPDLLVSYLPINSDDEIQIDFTTPYKRIDIIEELAKHGIDMPEDLYTDDARQYLDKKCVELLIDCSPPRTTSRLIDKMVGHYIEPQCINPTFVCNHPLVMSPLAKTHRDNSMLSERFELFMAGGTEVANAYSELNDPHEQERRFVSQQNDRIMGDDETPLPDQDYVDALKYGMAPTAGFGMGIDRLTMFLSNRNTIRDVILFPVVSADTMDE